MAELQERLSFAEFVEWQAFAANEALPAQRADIHTAMMMMLTATVNRDKKGHRFKLADFLPDWWQDKRSPAALAAKFRAFASMAGAGAGDATKAAKEPKPEEDLPPAERRRFR